jgi:hypothetical protein
VTLGQPPAGSPATGAPSQLPSTPAPGATPADDADPGRSRRTLGLVVGGVGAAGLVAGSVFGALTFSQWSQVKQACGADLSGCPAGATPSGPAGARSNAVTFGTISDIGFIAGGVLLATGAVLYLTAPRASVGLQITPGGVAAAGTF